MKIEDFRKVVVDTCFIVDVLPLNYLIKQNNKSDSITNLLPNDLRYNPKFRKNYLELLNTIEIFITSSHSIGELQRHFYNISRDLKKRFWDISFEYLKSKKLDEKLIQLLSLSQNEDYNKIIYDIGYVDTGLIELALKEKSIIITNDFNTLERNARIRGIDVFTSNILKHNSFRSLLS